MALAPSSSTGRFLLRCIRWIFLSVWKSSQTSNFHSQYCKNERFLNGFPNNKHMVQTTICKNVHVQILLYTLLIRLYAYQTSTLGWRRMVASRLHLRISYPCYYFYYEMIHHWRKSMEKAVESQSSFKGFFPGIDQWSAKWSPSAQSSRTTVNSVTLWQQCFLKTKEELFSKHEESLVVKPLEQISSWEISGMWCWSSTL